MNKWFANINADLLEKTFAPLTDQAEEFTEHFYRELFSRHSEFKLYFEDTELVKRQSELLPALRVLVKNLRKPESMVEALNELGRCCQRKGIQPKHYALAVETLVAVMKEIAGSLWSDEANEQWSNALNTVAQIMMQADEQTEEQKMSKSRKDELDELRAEQAHLRSIVNAVNSPLVTIDSDFVVTDVNEPARTLLKQRETEIATEFPGFKADQVIGTSIEDFWKIPPALRQKWSDIDKLPYNCNFNVGPIKISLTVSVQIDPEGNSCGNVLEIWDYTEQHAQGQQVARLQSAVEGAQANLMLCDENLVITYMNPAVVEMLAKRQTELRQIWPGFDAHNLVGECIDQFHKNPSHQRALLGDSSRLPASVEIKVGGLEFRINATAIMNSKQKYMGNMVEWHDITEEKDAERQIATLIDAASAGKLDERIDAERYQGFMHNLAVAINHLLETVVGPVQETTRVLESMANGDLTQEVMGDYQGQFAVMSDAVNKCIGNLQEMVGQIRDASGNISTSAGEIAQGNTDLSQRTEEQAASLEQTASSMEQLTSTVTQNAENSHQANTLASSARDQAQGGGKVVSDAISAMSEINAASKKIADIIGVIDEIAFQTNLLALNAAVEAARAGEQGRGFAVVASEVRNLAQRSAEAAKEIKTLINDSVAKVDEGSTLVDQSGSTLEEIVQSVKKVSDIIAEIAAASDEQASGIEQVNKAITQMDQMTQQNAALVEQAAAASESMDEQASGLNRLMEFFNIFGDGRQSSLPGTSVGENERRSTDRPWVRQDPVPVRQKQRTLSERVADRSKQRGNAGTAAPDSEWEEF